MWTRRDFLVLPVGLAAARVASVASAQSVDLVALDRARILHAANAYLGESPVTVTAASSPRSTGGLHDYFSEGDYWWPDPQNPERSVHPA